MATKKILTDLEFDGKIGIGMTPSNPFDMDITNVDNDSTIGVNLDINKENTSGAGFASNVNGLKSYTKGDSTETIVNISALWGKAEQLGSGTTYYITGGTNRGYHSGSGNSSAISGTFSEGKVGGTGSGDHSYVVGINSVAKLDNPNATVDYLQGQHCTVQLNDGEVTDNAMCLILDLDHTGGTISGDFEYLRIQNDTFDSAVGGTSRAINSLSTLPSEFGGSIQAPTFYLGGTASYIRNNAGDTELFADSSLSIESGDGMLIEISDVIDISGGGDIISDSAFTAQTLIKAGGTSSQFLKADGSVDSSTYLTSGDVTSSQWDAATGGINYAGGNVGIGTTTPQKALEVVGQTRVSESIEWGWGGVRIVGSTTTNDFRVQTWNGSSPEDRLIVNGSGKVGIGTTDPQANLHISKGTSNTYPTVSTKADLFILESRDSGNGTDSGMTIFTDNGATGNIYFGDEQSNQVVGITCDNTNGKTDLFFTTNGNNERLRIKGDGKVGIGTDSPDAKLEVVTAQSTTGAFNAALLLSNDAQTNNGGKTSIALATSTAPHYGYGISAERGATGSDSDFIITHHDNSLTGTERMRIDSSGNVGIGTDNPTSNLDIEDASGVTIDINSSSGDGQFRFQDAGVTKWSIGRDNTQQNFVFSNSSGLDADYVLTLAHSTGNVGIGTDSPAYRLDVRNSGNLFYGQTDLTDTTSIFRIRANGGSSEVLEIEANGNVGIGTVSPSVKLEVDTGVEMVAKFAGNTDGGTGYVGAVVEIESNNDARGRGVYLTHRLATDTSDSEWYAGVPYIGGGYSIGNAAYGTSINSNTGPAHKDQSKLFITEAGSVGIGTVSPSAPLSFGKAVYGNPSSEDFFRIKFEDAGGTNNDVGIGQDVSGSMGFNVNPSGYISFNRGTSGEAMRVHSNGKVGIGTDAPSEKLEVDGNAKADSFIKDGGASTEFLKADGSVDTNTYLTSADVTDSQWDDITGGINYGSGNVGIGTTDPQAKLDVNGGIRMGDDTTTASADNEGTMRYYTDDDGSYVDICMATLDSGYSGSDYHWINIVRNIFPA